MANREIGEIDVTIGGKEFVLRPDFESMTELEDRLDMSIFKVAMHLSQADIRAKYVVVALWAGCKHQKHGLSFDAFSALCLQEGAAGLKPLTGIAVQLVGSMFIGKEQKKSLAEPSPQM